jgi:hypothetical protein
VAPKKGCYAGEIASGPGSVSFGGRDEVAPNQLAASARPGVHERRDHGPSPGVATIPRCAECDARWLPVDEDRWQAWLTYDEPPEVAFYCPKCADMGVRRRLSPTRQGVATGIRARRRARVLPCRRLPLPQRIHRRPKLWLNELVRRSSSAHRRKASLRGVGRAGASALHDAGVGPGCEPNARAPMTTMTGTAALRAS